MSRNVAYCISPARHMQYTIRNSLLLLLCLCVSCSNLVPSSTETPSVILTPTATLLPTLTPVRTPPVGGLYVDARQSQGPISPLVFGSNYGPWLFVRLEMQPQAEQAHLTILRYPGGNWGDQNDLDEWSIDQFIGFTRQIGAQANIHVRLKGGTAQKAADLVRLVNVTKQYGVQYWTIGNEPNLYKDGYDTTQFNKDWREWAQAMRSVDPTIKLIGPETNQFFANPTDEYQKDLVNWVTEFLKVNGDMVDVVSFHRYPFPTSVSAGPPSADELRASSREWDDLIPAMRELVREYTGRDLPIAVTEVNSSWAFSSGGETTLDSHLNAIWWGDSLGRMIRQGAFMVNQFAIVGDFGLMGTYEVKPIYYVYRMYEHFGETLLYSSSDDPSVSIVAAQRADGSLTLIVVNPASSEKQQSLTIDGYSPTLVAETWLFDKSHNAELVESVSLATPIRLPPESMTLLVISSR